MSVRGRSTTTPLLATIARLSFRLPRIASNQLVGNIPTEIGLCSSLRELELANNKLESSIPSQLGSALSLERVDLRDNLLLGLLPTELSNLPALDVLYLSSNAFMGNIDSAVCNRPSSVPSWSVLEADCLGDLLTCSCCTSCCNSGGECK
jgi:Leucine-rich repeat (LRR) protein